MVQKQTTGIHIKQVSVLGTAVLGTALGFGKQ